MLCAHSGARSGSCKLTALPTLPHCRLPPTSRPPHTQVVPRLRVLLPSGDPRIAEAAIVELLGDHHLFAEPPAGAGGGDDEGGERAPADVAADLRAEHARTLLEACAWDARLKALVGPLLFTALTEVAASAP